ncbi:signal peptide peptidase SppA [Pasteurellaceae bacterium 15-036681]|nr:signal peptide peptidase SppA [Pasteurellaceae bacterium 15-036681]
MMNVLKGIYRLFRCVREFVVSLFFILFVMICFAIVSLSTSDSKSKKAIDKFENGALVLELDGYLADNSDDLGDLRRILQSELSGSEDPMKISTFDVVRGLKKAQFDDRIKGLVLDLGKFRGADLPSLQFVGQAIKDFKQSGKEVVAIGSYYSQSQYYLASFADQIYLNNSGFVELKGLNYSNLYFKAMFDKIEAVPHIFRVGTYKSAVEPFIRNDMSPEAKENAQLWLGQMWQSFSQDIADNRKVDAKTLVPEFSRYIEQYKALKGDDAQYALHKKLATHVVTQQQIEQALAMKFGGNKERFNQIDFLDYMDTLSDRFNVSAKSKIAVVNVEGSIVMGEGDESSAGSEPIVKALRKAKRDAAVKGVILRVNSPGGSAMASELIRQEVEAIQKLGKPVVTSMGGMAASGGYWIAATSDKIVASPTTLTGSIGIFGLAVTFEKTAKNLGFSEDGVSTSPLAKSYGFKTISKEQSELIQIGIENGYERFLDLVARGRKMTKAEVNKVAQGQVWTGESAYQKGLVDQLGDFNSAYDSLVELINQKRQADNQSKLESFETQWFADQKDDFLSQLMRDFKTQLKVNLSIFLDLPFSNKLAQPIGLLSQFNDPKQSYLYCLNCGTIK